MTRGGRIVLSFFLQFNPRFLKDYANHSVLIGIRQRIKKKQSCCTDSRVLSGAGRTTAKTIKTMKTHIPHIITLAATTGLLAIAVNTARAQSADSLDQSEFPTITAQPTDQAVTVGSNAVLSVQAINSDNYQWQSNGVAIDGQTNSTLTIQNVGVSSAGSYSCNVSKSGGDPVPTRAASLNVVMTSSVVSGQPIVVFGFPKASNGMQGTCPGKYAGYINYTKTISQGWGWAPSTNTTTTFTASDGSGRTDTVVTYLGEYGDTGCNQTTVTIPNPPYSPVYRFTIFFPNNVPTTNYPIVLTGFNQ
jgi:hypothetical protein